MAKINIGIDIGAGTLRLVQVSGSHMKKGVSVELPDSLVKDGRIVSIETMAHFIKDTMRQHGISGTNAAIILKDEQVYTRVLTMPAMTADQLEVNLPYEFSDYINEELRDYLFDYAVLNVSDAPLPEDAPADAAPSKVMELMAVAAPKELIEDMKIMCRKAGLKCELLAPEVSAFIGLIRSLGGSADQEYCFVDLSYERICMHMFKGDRYIVTRELETGLYIIEQAVADTMNVDRHLARTYLASNYNDCQNSEACLNAYNNIATELSRAVNFYQFSNPDANPTDMWFCGEGAGIESLKEELKNRMSLNTHSGEELLPGSAQYGFMLLEAYGITQE
ncbi:MAG: pilus assembly protein PilM [Parasporobacterium sp.]|nr:pilus assembly protein PilM [Parasporobacterium sp.]